METRKKPYAFAEETQCKSDRKSREEHLST